MNINPNCGNNRKEQQMNAITKTTSVAVLVALGLALVAGAAEPPKLEAPADWDKLVGQPVDLAPWAYTWRADRQDGGNTGTGGSSPILTALSMFT